MGFLNKVKESLSSTKNFQYLDKLIQSGDNVISLNSDIRITQKESRMGSQYQTKGIVIEGSNITIDGNGHTIDAKSIDGKGQAKIIFFIAGENVTIKNIVFTGSNQAIHNSGQANVIDCKFTHNSGHSGAAIYNEGKISLTGCELTENFGVTGGAIYNSGEIVIEDVLFKENSFKYGEAKGAAIYNDSAAAIFDSRFIENSSKYYGGAIYNEDEMKIHDSIFSENKSDGSEGGAIYNSGKLELLDSKFETNRARFATAIYNSGEINSKNNIFSSSNKPIYNDGTLNIEDAKFKDNSYVISNTGNLNIKNSTFNENDGHVIQNKDSGEINLISSKFSRNKTKNGAIYNDGGNLRINGNLFLENTSDEDGGVIHNKAIATIENSEFKHNRTDESGGAIYNERYQELGVGGAVYSEKENTLNILSTVFEDNVSKSGGSVSNCKGYVRMFNCGFFNHNGDIEIIFNNDKFDISNSIFKDNSSKSIILNHEKGELDIFDGQFLNNNLSKSAIHNRGDYASINESLFEGNMSDLKNAGNILNETKLKLKKVAIKDDGVTIFNKGAIFLKGLSLLTDGPGSVIGEEIPEDNFDFYYLDNLIHNSPSKEISLEHDVSIEYYEHDFYDGGIELDIDGLVIDGCGKTISGHNMSRIFLISGQNVVLKNINFKDGFLQEDYNNEMVGGAALRINSFSKVTIENCTFTDNQCGKNGGAILNFGLMDLSDCRFCENYAKNGAGIFNQSKQTTVIRNSIFSNNVAESGGGGMFNANDDIRILNCRFINNKAKIRGGGFRNTSYHFSKEGRVQIIDTEFEGNIALLQGGAVFNIGDELELGNVTFSNNAANGHGGALCNTGFKVNISDSLFENNMADILEDYLNDKTDGIKIRVTNMQTNLHVATFRYSSDKVMENMACNGGAILTSGDTVEIKNTKFINNTCKNSGGAIIYKKGGVMDISDSHFSDNKSAHGGSIFNDQGSLNITGSSLLGNESTSGGAIYNRKGFLNITTSSLSNNSAKKSGGAIFYDVGNVYLSRTGSYKYDPTVSIAGSTLSANIADGNGGAIWIKFPQFVKLTDCIFEENNPNDLPDV